MLVLTICTVWLKRSFSAVMLLTWSMSLCLREKKRSSWAFKERQDVTLDLYRSFSLLITEQNNTNLHQRIYVSTWGWGCENKESLMMRRKDFQRTLFDGGRGIELSLLNAIDGCLYWRGQKLCYLHIKHQLLGITERKKRVHIHIRKHLSKVTSVHWRYIFMFPWIKKSPLVL